MRPLTIGEIETLAAHLRSLAGARLQKVYSSEKDLVLEFYGSGQEFWLWWDLSPIAPVAVFLEARPPQLPRVKKPVALFIHSHGVNRHLVTAERLQGQGRVLRLYLGSVGTKLEDCCQIEGRLFPHGQNLVVKEDKKCVWWRKPQPLPEMGLKELVEAGRRLEEVAAQWCGGGGVQAKSLKAPKEADKKLKQEVARRERAICKIKQDLEKHREVQWRQLGEWLSASQALEVPEQWQKMIDSSKSFSWNLERCFQKAKTLEAKRGGTEERLYQLQEELSQLKSKGLEALKSQRPRVAPIKRGTKQEAKTRHLELEGKFLAYVGRSAKENLNLLRQARAWDLWLHLRDYPSSHCIIRRNKKEAVPEAALRQAAQWMARASFGRKAKQKRGEKLTLLYAECRYVQPIKGDKIGRVLFRNESTLTILL